MRIGVHPRDASAGSVPLGVQRISVVGLNAMMRAEEVPVAGQHAAAAGCGVVNSVLGGGGGDETAERLNRDLLSSGTLRLRIRGQRDGSRTCNQHRQEALLKHFSAPSYLRSERRFRRSPSLTHMAFQLACPTSPAFSAFLWLTSADA